MRAIAGRCPFNNCRTLKCQLATASNFERSGLIRLNCCSLGLGQPYVDLDWLINWLKICPIIFIACLNYCKSWGAWAALCGPWLQWSNFPQLPPKPPNPKLHPLQTSRKYSTFAWNKTFQIWLLSNPTTLRVPSMHPRLRRPLTKYWNVKRNGWEGWMSVRKPGVKVCEVRKIPYNLVQVGARRVPSAFGVEWYWMWLHGVVGVGGQRLFHFLPHLLSCRPALSSIPEPAKPSSDFQYFYGILLVALFFLKFFCRSSWGSVKQ